MRMMGDLHRNITIALPLLLAGGCEQTSEPAVPAPRANSAAAPQTPSEERAAPLFVDRIDGSGIDFVHDPTISGEYFLPEEIGSGLALIDVDGDGDLDLYLVDGGRHCGTEIGELRPNVLYRNDGDWRWTDVTAESGTGDTGYGMGVAAADYDNDGDQDLFITNVGRNVLLRNDGTGRFEDVTAAAGVAGDEGNMSLSAVFVDLDRDGYLDLYVTNYIVWREGVDSTCFSPGGVRDYCPPSMYRGCVDRLYRNRGDGTFEDMTSIAGIDLVATHSMGVVAIDFDHDGDEDLYVTCDGESNLLWVNQGDGWRFNEEAGLFGCAVNRDGVSEASMGIACVDIDGDGDEDLYLTHLAAETHTFYESRNGSFDDRTTQYGLGYWSLPDTGFGLTFFDAENDGDFDLFVGNGKVTLQPPFLDPDHPYAEPNRLLIQEDDRFIDRSADARPALDHMGMTRGVARGDLDGDGLVDLVVTNNRGRIQLLQNRMGRGYHWLGVRLEGTTDNRDGIGATIALLDRQADAPAATARVRVHSGYLSSHEPVLRFGLGEASDARGVEVTWPSGAVERFSDLALDTIHHLRQGSGTPVERQE